MSRLRRAGGYNRRPRSGLSANDAVEPGEWPQHVRNHERVAVLVVLPQEDQRAADGARGAVEGMRQLVALLTAYARPEAARREVAIVRARGELAVAAFRRQPHLEVVLLGRRGTEVAGG